MHIELTSPAVLQQRLAAGLVRNKDRANTAAKLFADAGCPSEEQKVLRRSNVICQLAGETSEVIVVGAHVDFVDAGSGMVDDWSGTALLSSLFENMHEERRKHTFRFIAFNAEELGLLGSQAYVHSLKREEVKQISAFVNLECLGVAPPKVWVRRSDPTLLRNLIRVAAAAHIDLAGVNVDNAGDDDTRSFLSKKVPVISIHSLTPETFGILHSQKDTMAALNPDNYYAAYKLVALYLAYLDSELP